MPKFSENSQEKLLECEYRLQKILSDAIRVTDFTIVCGHRDEAEQNKAFAEGKSKLKYPKSKHNSTPSLAVDIVPYRDGKLLWDDREAFVYLAGVMMGVAANRCIKLRWGGDFDMDDDFKDQTFNDLPHFELVD